MLYNANGFYQTKESLSDLLVGSNYTLDIKNVETGLLFQPTHYFRINYMFGYTDKINLLGKETTYLQSHKIEFKKIKTQNYNLSVSIKTISIESNQSELFGQSVIGYDMMEGLQQGQNYEWQLLLQKSILNGLQMSLRYQARKPSGKDVIHLGSVQITALL